MPVGRLWAWPVDQPWLVSACDRSIRGMYYHVETPTGRLVMPESDGCRRQQDSFAVLEFEFEFESVGASGRACVDEVDVRFKSNDGVTRSAVGNQSLATMDPDCLLPLGPSLPLAAGLQTPHTGSPISLAHAAHEPHRNKHLELTSSNCYN